MDDARVGQRAEVAHQAVEVDARQVLHRVVERSVVGAPVVVDGDRVRVAERRGHLDLALEPADVLGAHPVGAQHLHRRGPPQQRVPCQEDVAHRAAADLLLDQVFADAARLALGAGGAQPRTLGDGRAGHHARARQRQQREEGGEDALQRAHRLERLRGIDLRRDAEVAIVEPAPGAHHRHAPVVAIRHDAETVVTRGGRGRHRRERLVAAAHLRPVARGQIAAGVAQLDAQRAVVLVGSQQPRGAQVLGEAAGRDHESLAIERVGLAGRARACRQQRRRERPVVEQQAQDGWRVADRRRDEHPHAAFEIAKGQSDGGAAPAHRGLHGQHLRRQPIAHVSERARGGEHGTALVGDDEARELTRGEIRRDRAGERRLARAAPTRRARAPARRPPAPRGSPRSRRPGARSSP